MQVQGKHYRTIWPDDDGWSVRIIDQTLLPYRFEVLRLTRMEEMAEAITAMRVRGAPLIGAAAAYGVCLALKADASDEALERTCAELHATRPTAINLKWALDEMRAALRGVPIGDRLPIAYKRAARIADNDVETCRAIGQHGAKIIQQAAAGKNPGAVVNVLTHCNAGWLCAVDWGTALSPIYAAYDVGVKVHVWVDETRPRNQGASLTAFELGAHGVPHTVIADNAGGHLMQSGEVDLCITGTDRTVANGDVCNKIGTYLKALAAHDNGVPFYVALPHSTIDWTLPKGVGVIPIEERSAREVTHMSGRLPDGCVTTVEISAPGSPALNPAFDVTPARLVTGLITERGVCAASREGLLSLYPERASLAAKAS